MLRNYKKIATGENTGYFETSSTFQKHSYKIYTYLDFTPSYILCTTKELSTRAPSPLCVDSRYNNGIETSVRDMKFRTRFYFEEITQNYFVINVSDVEWTGNISFNWVAIE